MIRDLHSIEAKSNFRHLPGTKMAKSGDIMITAVSPVLPRNVRIHVDELGLVETAILAFEARAGITVTVEADQVFKVRVASFTKMVQKSFHLSLKIKILRAKSHVFWNQLTQPWHKKPNR